MILFFYKVEKDSTSKKLEFFFWEQNPPHHHWKSRNIFVIINIDIINIFNTGNNDWPEGGSTKSTI